jgi:hypothetical protein
VTEDPFSLVTPPVAMLYCSRMLIETITLYSLVNCIRGDLGNELQYVVVVVETRGNKGASPIHASARSLPLLHRSLADASHHPIKAASGLCLERTRINHLGCWSKLGLLNRIRTERECRVIREPA